MKLTPSQAFRAVQAIKALSDLRAELDEKKHKGDALTAYLHLEAACFQLADFLKLTQATR